MAIIDPLNEKNVRTWCDAYTMHLQVSAEASANPEMRKQLQDAEKRTQAEALRTRSQVDIEAAINQRRVSSTVFRFDPEGHREMMRTWASARELLLSMSPDMSKPIHMECDPLKKPLSAKLWQGKIDEPPANVMVITGSTAGIIVLFLRFVREMGDRMDPVTYTKKQLEAQGITRNNFHEHVGVAGITNPWE